MKYLCESCSRLVPAEKFFVSEGILVIVCPECAHETHSDTVACSSAGKLESQSALSVSPANTAENTTSLMCPKCAAPLLKQSTSCNRCGLVFSLFEPRHLLLCEAIEDKWQSALQNWESVSCHEQFVTACSETSSLMEAARRYRIRTEQFPHDQIAARFREDVTQKLMAIVSLEPKVGITSFSSARQRAMIVAFLLAAALAIGFLLWNGSDFLLSFFDSSR